MSTVKDRDIEEFCFYLNKRYGFNVVPSELILDNRINTVYNNDDMPVCEIFYDSEEHTLYYRIPPEHGWNGYILDD